MFSSLIYYLLIAFPPGPERHINNPGHDYFLDDIQYKDTQHKRQTE